MPTNLPTELDFTANPTASPARMDTAMAYIVARLKALEAIQPDFQAAINQLKTVGLDRLADALIPIFERATDIDAELQALQAEYETDTFKATQAAEILTLLRAGVAAEFDNLSKMAAKIVDYRSKYLGAKDTTPTVDDNGAAVASGAMYFDTVIGRMRVFTGTTWTDAGSAVPGVMARQEFTATGGETSVTVPGGYDVGNVIVSVNGHMLAPSDVTLTSGTSIGLPGALSPGDVVSWTKFGAITLTSVYNKTEADARFLLAANGYTKSEIDSAFALAANVYSKSAADGRFANLSLSNLTDIASARVNLGLGSAATRNESYFLRAGTGQTDLGVPTFVMSNAVASPTTAITISAGSARDSTNNNNIVLTNPITKYLTSAWAAGDGNGGRDTGSVAAAQTWHVFVIYNPTTSAVDALFSQSVTAPTLPSGFTQFRRIGSIVLDVLTATIVLFKQEGNWFRRKQRSIDCANTSNGGSATLRSVGVPYGIKVRAEFYFQSVGTATDVAMLSGVYDPDMPLPTWGDSYQWAQVRRFGVWRYPGAWASYLTTICYEWTNASAQVYTYSSDSADVIALGVRAWEDDRRFQ